MKVAITGATGFVGGHLIDYLGIRGIEVIPFSRAANFVKNVQCIMMNYSDSEMMQMQLQGVDVVVHLGGLAHQLHVQHTLEQYIHANVDATLSIANASKLAGIKRFIYISSIGVNGDSTEAHKAFTEEDIPKPSNHYAYSKLKAEEGVRTIFDNSNTEFVILRPPLIYGSDCAGNFQLLLRLTSSKLILPFGSLSSKKSMIYIDNFLEAIFICLRAPRVANQIFIISDSEILSLNEIIFILLREFHGPNARNICFPPTILELLAKIVGKQSQWQKFSSQLEVNADKFFMMTDWRPLISQSEGLKKCTKGFLSND